MYRIVVASAPDPMNRYCVQLAKTKGRKTKDGSPVFDVVFGPSTYKECQRWINKRK